VTVCMNSMFMNCMLCLPCHKCGTWSDHAYGERTKNGEEMLMIFSQTRKFLSMYREEMYSYTFLNCGVCRKVCLLFTYIADKHRKNIGWGTYTQFMLSDSRLYSRFCLYKCMNNMGKYTKNLKNTVNMILWITRQDFKIKIKKVVCFWWIYKLWPPNTFQQ
jgi:hypothetical protein